MAASRRVSYVRAAGIYRKSHEGGTFVGSRFIQRVSGVLNFLMGWFKALRWQRLPEMERLGDFVLKHIEGIAAYCDHAVRVGVVESINTTIKAVLRRARGMRDEEILLLNLKWATANPSRSAQDLMRFLTLQPLYSNR
jgi:hypothetical protein